MATDPVYRGVTVNICQHNTVDRQRIPQKYLSIDFVSLRFPIDCRKLQTNVNTANGASTPAMENGNFLKGYCGYGSRMETKRGSGTCDSTVLRKKRLLPSRSEDLRFAPCVTMQVSGCYKGRLFLLVAVLVDRKTMLTGVWMAFWVKTGTFELSTE